MELIRVGYHSECCFEGFASSKRQPYYTLKSQLWVLPVRRANLGRKRAGGDREGQKSSGANRDDTRAWRYWDPVCGGLEVPHEAVLQLLEDYKLYEEVGEGGSAKVYRALCVPFNEIVAVKVFDLEKCKNDLSPRAWRSELLILAALCSSFLVSFAQEAIRQEVQTMTLIEHPNLLRAHCSFATGSSLWIVVPYMAGGSCLHIMESAYPEGFQQPVFATLLYEVLKALVYLHSHGLIHRDVKAGNILVDSKGAVKLADFGVAARLFDSGDRQQSRKSFVGTPCWMAPEVMQQLHGYDFKADIWSFGITALELAHGHAPFSNYPPAKVLLMTLQNAPPGLDTGTDKRFSKSFKAIVAACLVKDPLKRPTPEKLLKHQFFKHARSNEFLARTILDGLSPLGDRFRMLKVYILISISQLITLVKACRINAMPSLYAFSVQETKADLIQGKAMYYKEKDQLSQLEYIQGISAWNFDLADLKKQAALIQDDDGISDSAHQGWSRKQSDGFKDSAVLAERPSEERFFHSKLAGSAYWQENGNLQNVGSSPASSVQSIEAFDDRLPYQVRDKSKLPSKDALDEDIKSNRLLEMSEADSRIKVLAESPESAASNDAPDGFISSFLMPRIDTSVLSMLQCIFRQNAMQREQIVRFTRVLNQPTGKNIEYPEGAGDDNHLQRSLASARERVLQAQVIRLQQRIEKLDEELQRWKITNAEMERQVNASLDK
ncbi:Serine/threonine-protein kinase fray2 [Morella rubra]|uniref:Serine/threonine-protein kinase fray2 n=1 Tax=Morella rubra TaxID=262757 RepID=A0A6A1ULV5_9ROSI|nr:Serine/threonine-protein kinase fray2 [Morella rubra]